MAKLQSINPYTEELNAEFETVGIEEVNKIIDKANKAYINWKDTTIEERKELFLKLADVLESEIEECAKLETIEMGMLNHISKTGLQKTANLIRWFANNTQKLLGGDEYELEGVKVKEVYDSIGVIFGVAPWNFPFNQLLRAAVPNILAGNTQIYKHSSNVPLTALKIEKLFKKAGFPEGVYTNIFVSSSLSEEIIKNKYITGVNLTGSETAGSAVGALAGKYLKRSVLELGGNDAMVILEDAEIDNAVKFAVSGRTRNGGQACNASKRILVPETIYDEFLDKYSKAMSSLKMGDPMDSSTELQPLSSRKAVEEIDAQVKRAVESGARITAGGKIPDMKGYFYEATVLADVTTKTSSFNEEIFGPVASVMKYKDLQEAISLANGTDFGLSATVFSSDIQKAIEVGQKLDGGMIFVNSNAGSRADSPFGGVKKSGYGKENGVDGLRAFTNKKVIIY